MKYYKVDAKCGHVGRNNYIIKSFYVCALNGKEAARIVKYLPRVKHHHKDAIRNVQEIAYKEYVDGIDNNKNDAYFNVHNSSDQNEKCVFGYNEIIKEEEPTLYKKIKHIKKHIIESIYIKEWKRERDYIYE